MFSSKLCDQDDFIDRYIKGEIPRYKNHLNLDEENIEKELNRYPIFMTETATEKDFSNSEDLPALQILKYENKSNEEIAEFLKDSGNLEYKKGKKNRFEKRDSLVHRSYKAWPSR
jgi:hypothetical protein